MKSIMNVKKYLAFAVILTVVLQSILVCNAEEDISRLRDEQMTTVISVYTDGGSPTYYGAKNEKKNGVLFGICSDGETRKKTPNESMVLTYQELGQHLLTYNTDVVKKASEQGLAVEFALNCPNKSNDIRSIRNKESYLKEISDMLNKYKNVPVYLRFAAEFDIWDSYPDAESFKSAFRYVSDYFKGRNSNVAMVWSPNQVSNANINVDDYYPGDEYVDWVGISSYAAPYFLGDRYQSDENMLSFRAGMYSNPVLAIKKFVEKYGNRKPIMISECGCTHKLVTSGENFTSFAMQRLREYFAYIPMVYPQVKLIAYFDNYVNNSGETNDYRLSTNSQLQDEFCRLTKEERFIQNGCQNETELCYRKISDGTQVGSIFPASCYAYKFNDEPIKVSYYIDDVYRESSSVSPFSVDIDASRYSGEHVLKTVVSFSSGAVVENKTKIRVEDSQNISVKISNKKINFDQPPVLYRDRTMVPMRRIFEELGAEVFWDQRTKTASGKRGDRTVKFVIGNDEMYINNKCVKLDVPAMLLSGRTLVPVRAISEGFGCDVDWDIPTSTVLIEPKVFTWSDWNTSLPSDVDRDLFYIEEKTEYRFRTREKEEFSLSVKNNSSNYVRDDSYYGNWSDWQNNYIASSDDVEVETRTQSSPKKYHYAHYCTGYNDDESLRYKTSNRKFSDLCSYHDLGWYDHELPDAPDGNGADDILYNSDGSKYNCSNYCWRWYVVETSGGDYTQYRSRNIYHNYIYWQWGDWSGWSSWRDYNPYSYYDSSVDVDERTVYRYKEK